MSLPATTCEMGDTVCQVGPKADACVASKSREGPILPLMAAPVRPTPAYVASLPRLMEWKPSPSFAAKLYAYGLRRVLKSRSCRQRRTVKDQTHANKRIECTQIVSVQDSQLPISEIAVTHTQKIALSKNEVPAVNSALPLKPSQVIFLSLAFVLTTLIFVELIIFRPPSYVLVLMNIFVLFSNILSHTTTTPKTPTNTVTPDVPPPSETEVHPAYSNSTQDSTSCNDTPDQSHPTTTIPDVPSPIANNHETTTAAEIFSTTTEPFIPPPPKTPNPALLEMIEFSRIQFDNLHCDMWCDIVEQYPPVKDKPLKATVNIVKGHPVVWHSCQRHYCSLCNEDLEDYTKRSEHYISKEHKDEIVRQDKFHHKCALCLITTTSLPTFRTHINSKKHSRAQRVYLGLLRDYEQKQTDDQLEV